MERNPYNPPYDTRREPDEEPVPESPEPLTEEERREAAAHEGDRLVAGEGTHKDAQDDLNAANDLAADQDRLGDPYATGTQDPLDDRDVPGDRLNDLHKTGDRHKGGDQDRLGGPDATGTHNRLDDPDTTSTHDRLGDPDATGTRDRLDDPFQTGGPTDEDQFGDPRPGEFGRDDVRVGPGPVHQPLAADGAPVVAPLSEESDARLETPDDVLAPDAVTVPEQRLPEDVYPQDIDFDARWHDIKAGFVDDPRDSVEKADALIDEAVSALAARRQALVDGWKNGDQNDTEQLRLALREYRSLFDKLKG
ncbi:hypothetical protein Aph01nite_22110 [Acrocarpospora phusangensis]|uniref:Uncharacterized protein n=1 Tax=Acrocarpospora phusangensis TaxID=1070424 RepID=A0A919Q9E2_9ACTN|nr:hypothetical protein [Acrocarpospora phusangensis]GIH23901.1 hypothetical protein Aph01nite_22110 [Acrocarpospora phusangensis]